MGMGMFVQNPFSAFTAAIVINDSHKRCLGTKSDTEFGTSMAMQSLKQQNSNQG